MRQPLKTVAFADDDPGILRILEMACSDHYQIVGQGRYGLEALTLVKTLKPQLLVLDLHMPGMDGLEVLRQIVPLQTTAVVILTADEDPQKAGEAMDLGACGYVTKPFEYSQVVPMLETAWHAFQAVQVLQSELAVLNETLDTRKLLEKAKGILMLQQGLSEEAAHKTLQKLSQDQAISLKEVCRSIIQVRMVLGKSAPQRKAV